MKLIAMMLALGVLGGQAGAAGNFDLNGAGAAEVSAKAGQNLPPIPQVPPIFPPNNWPGQPGFPQNPHGGLDTCEYTGMQDGKCLFKCASGAVIAEPPVKTGPAGAETPVCASHVFLPLPAVKSARTMEDWQSVYLRADDGTEVIVDYVPANLGGKVLATHVWVNVRNPGFTGGEAVSAKLTNYYEATPYSAEAPREEAELSLLYSGWNFQTRFPDLSIFEAHHAWSHSFRQELAVFVNGRRLTDGTGKPAFSFRLPGKPEWAKDGRKDAQKGPRACLFKELKDETCSYSCADGKPFSRPAARPSPFGDEPVVPCPAVVFPF